MVRSICHRLSQRPNPSPGPLFPASRRSPPLPCSACACSMGRDAPNALPAARQTCIPPLSAATPQFMWTRCHPTSPCIRTSGTDAATRTLSPRRGTTQGATAGWCSSRSRRNSIDPEPRTCDARGRPTSADEIVYPAAPRTPVRPERASDRASNAAITNEPVSSALEGSAVRRYVDAPDPCVLERSSRSR